MPQLHALCRVETTGLKINIYLIFSLFCKYPAVWLDKSLSLQFTFLRGSLLRPKISPEKTFWEAAATRTRPSCPSLFAASARGLSRGGGGEKGKKGHAGQQHVGDYVPSSKISGSFIGFSPKLNIN